MNKTVSKKPKQFGVSTLCRLMDDCIPAQMDDERDMQDLINKLWPALVVEHEIESDGVAGFLEKEAPLYDHSNAIDDKYCCEKTLLTERERLHGLAKANKK